MGMAPGGLSGGPLAPLKVDKSERVRTKGGGGQNGWTALSTGLRAVGRLGYKTDKGSSRV